MKLTITGLHPGQISVLNCPQRYVALCAGRRWGKSTTASVKALQSSAQGKRILWLAPTYRMARNRYRDFLRWTAHQEKYNTLLEAYLPKGGSVEFRSGETLETIRGEGYDGIVINEASFFVHMHEAFQTIIRPTISDRQGWIFFESSPRGKNWFYQMWLWCKQSERGAAFHFPSSSAPHLPAEELEDARSMMSERMCRQELDAEFLDDAETIVHPVTKIVTKFPNNCEVLAIDWGRKQDHTAIVAGKEGEIWLAGRFQGGTWEQGITQAASIVDGLQPKIVVAEENSMGDALIEALETKIGRAISRFSTQTRSKSTIIDGIDLEFSNGLTVLSTSEENNPIAEELSALRIERISKAGVIYDSVISDDCAIAACICAHFLYKTMGASISVW